MQLDIPLGDEVQLLLVSFSVHTFVCDVVVALPRSFVHLY